MHPDWARSIRDACVAAGTKFYFKQWGEWWPNGQTFNEDMVKPHSIGPERVAWLGRDGHALPIGLGDYEGPEIHLMVNRIGKAAAGRELGGRQWKEMAW